MPCQTLPMFGVVPVVLDEEGKELTGACEGFLAIKNSWPGQVRFKVQILCFSLFTDLTRCALCSETTSVSSKRTSPALMATTSPGMVGKVLCLSIHADTPGCRRDADGYFWITGRTDDVLNVRQWHAGTLDQTRRFPAIASELPNSRAPWHATTLSSKLPSLLLPTQSR